MVFKNINQLRSAEKALIEAEGNVNLVFKNLQSDKQFSNLSEAELFSALEKLNEGLGDKILNFFSKKLGGDISKIKTVLGQMKEQELKFNQEEFEIYNQFYSLIQDQKALDKDKKNPNYNAMNKDLAQSRNALNVRMKELTKTHNEIFNALEEKIKGLVDKSNRKKKYFNAQRATDVLETKNDRYEKIKAITAKSAERSNELNAFFGIEPDEIKQEAEVAKDKAKESIESLQQSEPVKKSNNLFTEEPEKGLQKRLLTLIEDPGSYYAKRNELETLKSDLEDIFKSEAFKKFAQEKKINLHVVYNETGDYLEHLENEEKKIKS